MIHGLIRQKCLYDVDLCGISYINNAYCKSCLPYQYWFDHMGKREYIDKIYDTPCHINTTGTDNCFPTEILLISVGFPRVLQGDPVWISVSTVWPNNLCLAADASWPCAACSQNFSVWVTHFAVSNFPLGPHQSRQRKSCGSHKQRHWSKNPASWRHNFYNSK